MYVAINLLLLRKLIKSQGGDLNHGDYVNKMILMLSIEKKFLKLGPVEFLHRTKISVLNLQKSLLKLMKETLHPRMYF